MSIFWQNNQAKILVAFLILLVGWISFRAGGLYQASIESSKVEIKLTDLQAANPREEKILALAKAIESKGIKLNETVAEAKEEIAGNSVDKNQLNGDSEKLPVNESECSFVASKNSNKYHKSSCAWAQKIKTENRVCFSSEEEAGQKGYQPAGCCFKR